MNQFREHTTNTAFSLQLSANMVEYLVLLDQDKIILHRTFIQSEDACARRGLVERKSTCPFPAAPPVVLTPAGIGVLGLLKLAGLYDDVLVKYDRHK